MRVAAERQLESSLTLVLEHVNEEFTAAHYELYPERVGEHIPPSITLLYPWKPPAEITDPDLERLREFFGSRSPLEFSLTRVTEFPGIVVYAVPEPDDDLRSLMRDLWVEWPDYPPYGQEGFDPPPHATLGRAEPEREDAITVEQAQARIGHLLPLTCDVREVTLMEMYELDRWRVREAFPLAA